MEEQSKVRPQDRYNQKNNLVAKTYRLNKDVADEFAKACEKVGVAKSTQLTKMMQEFIAKVNNQ